MLDHLAGIPNGRLRIGLNHDRSLIGPVFIQFHAGATASGKLTLDPVHPVEDQGPSNAFERPGGFSVCPKREN